MSAVSATASSRSRARRLAGAALLALAGLAAPAVAQQAPEQAAAATAQPAYRIFHSHVGWHAAAVAASDARQAGASWTAMPSHIARSNGNWQPTLLPDEAAKADGRPAPAGDAKIDLSR